MTKFLASIGSESLISSLLKGELSSFSELVSSGKSGSFFFYSVDGKYVLKTISKEEFIFLRKSLEKYYIHLKSNRNSLLPKFFSLNKIRFNNKALIKELGYDQVYFVVMNNIFSKNRIVHERYDLKGSTYKRETFHPGVLPEYDIEFKNKEITLAMKDLDFLRRKKSLNVTGAQKDLILKTIEKDSVLFKELNIIDYSLLVGVHYKDRSQPVKQEEKLEDEFDFGENIPEFGGSVEEVPTSITYHSPDGNEIYFIGIIDILTSFSSFRKKCEYLIKRICIGKSISCIPPKDYAERFQEFLKTQVFMKKMTQKISSPLSPQKAINKN